MRAFRAPADRDRVLARTAKAPLIVGPRALLLLLLAWAAVLAMAFLAGLRLA